MKDNVKLGTLGNIFIGLTYRPEDVADEGTIVLRSSNIQNGRLDFDDIVRVKCKVRGNLIVKPNDILMCSRNGSAKLVGKCTLLPEMDEEMAFGAFMTIIRTQHNPYLLHFFNSNAFRCQLGSSATTTINQITRKMLDDISVPIYPKEQEEHMVSVLDQIDELILIERKKLGLFDELVKSRFVEMMNSTELGDETTIEAVTEQVKVGFVGACEKYYTDESGVPMLRTGNITDKGIDAKDLKYVTGEFHEKNKKSQIHTGDLLIARHGSNGQANVYLGPEAQCLNAVVVVPKQDIVSSIFLAGLINSPMVKEQIEQTLVGSTQRVVNTKSIAKLRVRIPSVTVQKQYEVFVEQVDKSKIEVKESLEKLETLKKALMQEYFG